MDHHSSIILVLITLEETVHVGNISSIYEKMVQPQRTPSQRFRSAVIEPLYIHGNVVCEKSSFDLFVFQSKFERDLIVAMLAFSICVPSIFTFFESLMKSVFGNKAWPSFGTILVVSIYGVGLVYFGLAVTL